jgi:hypothetical protein
VAYDVADEVIGGPAEVPVSGSPDGSDPTTWLEPVTDQEYELAKTH